MISVIVCTFNHGNYIKRFIESVLSQKYEDYELIIVNDASTDNTDKILSEYIGNKKVKIITNPVNMNLMKSRKIGFDNSIGDYILFADADDYYVSDDVLEAYSKKFGFDIVHSYCKTGNSTADWVYNNYIYKYPLYFNSLIIKYISRSNYIWNKMYSRNLVNKIYEKLKVTDCFLREDVAFNKVAYSLASSYDFLNKVTYFYSLDTGYSRNSKKLEDEGGRVSKWFE